jgi:putative Mg2+ transporter-C (MgtC) family protein
MGIAIGFEREWGQHTAGLRTNALVAFGAALYVSLPRLLGGTPTSAQLAGQVVTGVGFLGGGVILREGLTIRGMNTAATIWCSAAVGSLTGAGFPLMGLAGTVGVLTLNVALRPVSDALQRRLRRARNIETLYRLRATCRAGQEGAVRAVLLQFFHDHATMTIQTISTQGGMEPDRACVAVEIHSEQRNDHAMEELMARVDAEPSVSAVTWERNPST